MRASLLLAALALLAADAPAQVLQITSASRDCSAIATGFDYDFDDGVGSAVSTTVAVGPWVQDLAYSLSDYDDNEVSSAVARHASDLGPGGVRAELYALGAAGGELYYTDGWSDSGLDVAFTAPFALRYRLRIDATTTDVGYAVAEARLNGPNGSVASVYVYDGASQCVEQRGWLEAGAHDLAVAVQAVAIGGSGMTQVSASALELDLQLVHVADYDIDGDVSHLDRIAFRRDHLARRPVADFDGDGDIDRADRRAFRAAWRAARLNR